MVDPSAFEAQLAALRKQYTIRLSDTLDDLVQRVAIPCADIDQTILSKLHADLHKLVGSGGTFGFAELSRQARLLEMMAKDWLNANTFPDQAQWQEWSQGISDLFNTIADRSEIAETNKEALAEELNVRPLSDDQRKPIRVLLIEDKLYHSEQIKSGLSQFGYEIAHCTDFVEAERLIIQWFPDVLVVDIVLTGPIPTDSTEVLPTLFERLGYALPCIFLAQHTDFYTRLAVASAGAGAFLAKSVDSSLLAGRIEMLLREREHEPYRVLIVDDDEVLSEHYRLILQAAGMLVEKVCHPRDTLIAMQKLNPDLVIIDLYMPDCKGSDLALAIRYEDAWMSLPIVYLSAEDDLNEQIKALNNGGDDFLTKPISDVRLVATVRARAARARKLNELMSQDSLTGLLKHGTIKERMMQEFERARRIGTVMSLAIVDLDHFKRVNDTWGHPMGDQVIKTLAHLLRQRLRRLDSIGRYGEEFVIVLPECNERGAFHVLDDIRQRFAEICFTHQAGQSFSITLSAGVVCSSQCHDKQSLFAAADTALYQAKNNGRNQVCQYHAPTVS